MWCDEGRNEKRGRSLCGEETRRRAGGEMSFQGGDEKRDEGRLKPVMWMEWNGRGILMNFNDSVRGRGMGVGNK